MEKKTLSERYADEQLSDNSAVQKYEQCKNCIFRDDGTVYSNDYRKSCCRMYPYPKFKPISVMDGSERCEYYEQEKKRKK
jgi:hypothetical protein